jgi:hypothetical protein
MNDLSTKTSGGYYFNESKKRCGSFNAKHYDEIITKLRQEKNMNALSNIHRNKN